MVETKIKLVVSVQGGRGCTESGEKGWPLSKRGSERASPSHCLGREREKGGVHWAEWPGKNISDQGNRNVLGKDWKAGEGTPHSGNCQWAV